MINEKNYSKALFYGLIYAGSSILCFYLASLISKAGIYNMSQLYPVVALYNSLPVMAGIVFALLTIAHPWLMLQK